MKKISNEHPVKTYARKMLREGSIDEAEASLAAKDISDRIQDFVEDISKMVNDELPKLSDKIRSTFGSEQADTYQQTANSVLSDLLNIAKEKKAALEQAVLVLTGDAQAEQEPKTDLALPEEPSDEDNNDLGDLDDDDFQPDAGSKTAAKRPSPLGREPRLPAAESRIFNKKLNDAKIVALKTALDETDTKKFPLRARRLAEELNRVAIIAIKEEAKTLAQKKADEDAKRRGAKGKTLAQKRANERAAKATDKINEEMKVCPSCKGKGPKQPKSKTDISCKTCKGSGKVADNVKE